MAKRSSQQPFRFSLKQLFCVTLFLIGMLLMLGNSAPGKQVVQNAGGLLMMLSVLLAAALDGRLTKEEIKKKAYELFSIANLIWICGYTAIVIHSANTGMDSGELIFLIIAGILSSLLLFRSRS